MKYFGLTDKGIVRAENQDCFSITEVKSKKALIVALCDGMGGASAGGLASSISNEAFVDYVQARLTSRVWRDPDYRQVLQSACEEANGITYEYSGFSDDYAGLGTTLVAAVVSDSGRCTVVNVGDSRAYLISAREKKIRQITNDHSLVETYVRAGLITKEQARVHPQKNIITRALGSERTVESDAFEAVLKKNDMLLLCSDGLSNNFSDEELLQQALENPDPEIFCREMLRLTYLRGAADNVTIISVVRD